jgi:hypothetical protein
MKDPPMDMNDSSDANDELNMMSALFLKQVFRKDHGYSPKLGEEECKICLSFRFEWVVVCMMQNNSVPLEKDERKT